MNRRPIALAASLLLSTLALGAGTKPAPPSGAESPAAELTRLKKLSAQLAPVELTADLTKLDEGDRAALGKILEAAQLMDALFLRQVWGGNEALLLRLVADPSPLGKERLHLFWLNKGPWDRLDHDTPLFAGVPPKPAQANFYGAYSKEEMEAYFKGLPPAARELATGFFTTVRKGPDGKWSSVPFSVEYQGELLLAAQKLLEAAELTHNASLQKFLRLRAQAFLSNDYYASDVAWMELDSDVEPTLGPYEVYEDGWFNQKAAFESFIALRDAAETQKLAGLSAHLQELEDHLPLEDAFKNPKLGALAPIRVVTSIFSSGDGNKGVQTAAYNLPNDERIEHEKGTKRVMLKNVQEAKFKKVLLPIANLALAAPDRKLVAFDPFFTHILMHELMHGLGPHNVEVKGRKSTVRQELEDAYSAMEEAKADVCGLWALQYLLDHGVLDKALEKGLYQTYLASAFRSIRFGVAEAHGRGVAMQLNYLLDKGAVSAQPDGTFKVAQDKIRAAVTDLAHDLLTIQAHGDRAAALQMLDTLGVVRPPVQKVLDKLSAIPVDIEPRYTTAEKLLAESRKGHPAR